MILVLRKCDLLRTLQRRQCLPCIRVVFLRVMGLVEDQEVDLGDFHEAIEHSMVEDFSRAHNDHVLGELV